ncbi:MAG: 2-oxo acid dehydrogenase subunit E2 [Dehalococcoidia bacterium]
MATEVVMPQMGAEMEEGTIVRWLKQPGEPVKRGEALAEIETDKATMDLESFDEGIFQRAVAGEGAKVKVGDVIAFLGAAGETLSLEPAADAISNRNRPAADQPQPTLARAIAQPDAIAAAVEKTDLTPAREPVEAVSEGLKPPSNTASSGRTSEPARGGGEPEDGRMSVPAQAAPPVPAVVSAKGSNGARAAPPPRLRVSPLARNIAAELCVDLRQITGSGPDGRIMRRDVEAVAAEARGASPASTAEATSKTREPAPEQVEWEMPAVPELAAGGVTQAFASGVAPLSGPSEPMRDDQTAPAAPQPLSRMRQAIARRMAQSKREAPHYYITVDVDMTEAMVFRAQVNAAAGDDAHITVNDLLIKAAVLALKKYPPFNASFGEQGLIEHSQINLCLGVALPEGLVAPALLDCGSKSLGEIARAARDLSERTRNGHLRAAELSQGTFTISNLGAYGVETLIAIIQPPQAAIIGAGMVQSRPVVRDGQIVAREMLKLALSADHRVTDGAQGAEFMREVKIILEAPLRLAL